MRGGRHRDGQGNAVRAVVLGAGDGLITDISLVLGVAGANAAGQSELQGWQGCSSVPFRWPSGELVSVRARDELLQHEIDMERGELQTIRSGEQRERAIMHQARGLADPDADAVARVDDQPCGAENIVHPE